MTPAVSWWEAQRYAENKSDCAKKNPKPLCSQTPKTMVKQF